jgi:glycosyltransferase involved in cell wall biosynthesis
MQNRSGKGNALACGFAAATGDIIVMVDADGSADPAEIPRFVEALLDGADFAKGSRFADVGGSFDVTRLCRLATPSHWPTGSRLTSKGRFSPKDDCMRSKILNLPKHMSESVFLSFLCRRQGLCKPQAVQLRLPRSRQLPVRRTRGVAAGICGFPCLTSAGGEGMRSMH